MNTTALYLSKFGSPYFKKEANSFNFFRNKVPEQSVLADPYPAARSPSLPQRQMEGESRSHGHSPAPDIAHAKALHASLMELHKKAFSFTINRVFAALE